VRPLAKLGRTRYDATVLAVGHQQFKDMGIRAVRRLLKPKSVVYDIKNVFRRKDVDGRL